MTDWIAWDASEPELGELVAAIDHYCTCVTDGDTVTAVCPGHSLLSSADERLRFMRKMIFVRRTFEHFWQEEFDLEHRPS